jgi:prophage regulatory protein
LCQLICLNKLDASWFDATAGRRKVIEARMAHINPDFLCERLIGAEEVRRRVDLSRSTIWRLERAGDFPRSVQISPGRRAWREADVDRWISEKLGTSAP